MSLPTARENRSRHQSPLNTTLRQAGRMAWHRHRELNAPPQQLARIDKCIESSAFTSDKRKSWKESCFQQISAAKNILAIEIIRMVRHSDKKCG